MEFKFLIKVNYHFKSFYLSYYFLLKGRVKMADCHRSKINTNKILKDEFEGKRTQ